MLHELHLAWRQLGKTPGQSAIIVLLLALGLGANTAIFSIINGVLLKPLPYPEGDRLVSIVNSFPQSNIDRIGVSIISYKDWRDGIGAFADAGIFGASSANFTSQQGSKRLVGLESTPSLFTTLGVQPALGRTFTDDETKPGNERVIVLTHDLWQTEFNGSREVLGQTCKLDGTLFQIVGVLPAWFKPPQSDARYFRPIKIEPADLTGERRGWVRYNMIARLKPGATLEQAIAQCELVNDRITKENSPTAAYWITAGHRVILESYLDTLVGAVRPTLLVLQAGVLLLLAIACANVANLLLVRGHARERDFALKSALGASRWQLMRQLVAGGLVLSIAGALAGLVLGWAGVRLIGGLGIDQLPRNESVALDVPVFLSSFVFALGTGLLFGLIPLAILRDNSLALVLRASSSKTSGNRVGICVRNGLIVTEIALSTLLLLGAALLVRSFLQLNKVNPGFAQENVLTARVVLPRTSYPDNAARLGFTERILSGLRALPGVEHAAITDSLPFTKVGNISDYTIEGVTLPVGAPPLNKYQFYVTEDYFRALKIPLLQGRFFNAADRAEGVHCIIIDRVLAGKYFRNSSPLGQRIDITFDDKTWHTIVGVVDSVHMASLSERGGKESIYGFAGERPQALMTLIVSSHSSPSALTQSVRDIVKRLDPDLALYDIKLMQDRVDATLQNQRTSIFLLGIFATVALVLAAVGIYGVLAFSVGQRTREIGIRMALGALPADVLCNVLGQGARLLAAGLGAGLLISVATARFLRSQLYSTSPYDPWSFGLVVIFLAVATFVSCWLPARRAARVDPLVALRAE